MRLLVSSKNLAKKLSEIPESESVCRATLNPDGQQGSGILTLITQERSIDVSVHILKFEASVKQNNIRWDWISDIVSKVNEQPMILEIHEKVTNVVFQC